MTMIKGYLKETIRKTSSTWKRNTRNSKITRGCSLPRSISTGLLHLSRIWDLRRIRIKKILKWHRSNKSNNSNKGRIKITSRSSRCNSRFRINKLNNKTMWKTCYLTMDTKMRNNKNSRNNSTKNRNSNGISNNKKRRSSNKVSYNIYQLFSFQRHQNRKILPPKTVRGKSPLQRSRRILRNQKRKKATCQWRSKRLHIWKGRSIHEKTRRDADQEPGGIR